MVIREAYLERLREWRGKYSIAKAIMGVRRCGKSTLLAQYIDELKKSGVPSEDIISIDFENVRWQHISNREMLNKVLIELVPLDRPVFLFLDEIQEVDGWERSVAGMCNQGNVDVYITGSNGHVLSTELTTHLTGRFIEIPMLPPSFHEFCCLYRDYGNSDSLLDSYLRGGSMPVIDPSMTANGRRDMLMWLSDSIISKDIASRKKTPNSETARKIAKFLFSNIGNETSISNIADGIKLSTVTVQKYVDALIAAGLFIYAEKYDIVGQKILQTNGKYYATDMGLRNVNLKQTEKKDLSRPIENIVFLELIRRGYDICIGSYRGREIDFLATRGDTTEYFQVCQTILSDETRDREFRSFNDMKDSFPKIIITTDRIGLGNYGGIRVVNLTDWLLDDGVEPKVVDAPASWRIGQITIADD